MTRIGVNPARGKVSGYRPARVTVAILTYVPDQEGYFQHRLEVLQLVLASLKAHTTLPYDLFVFDNGSCPAVRQYLLALRDAGEIDFLCLSHVNIGKIGAFQVIFKAAPGEIIAYADDDILFYPGWLEAHLEILEKFPRAGMVSGVPVREGAGYACESLKRLQTGTVPGLEIRFERCVPPEWEADWAVSTGRDPATHLQATREVMDTVLSLGGIEAIGTANHFQFVARKEVIVAALPQVWSAKLMGSMVELDQAIDANGYLRLSTTGRFTRHLGNTISSAVAEEARALGLTANQPVLATKAKRRPWITRLPGSRRVFKSIYSWLFDLLYGVD